MAKTGYTTRWWKHQVDWLHDQSRFRIAIKARQIGWSTIIALEAALNAILYGELSILASRSERQSVELLRKVRPLLSYALLGTDIVILRDTSDSIELSNGGRVISVPAAPDTVAGFTGHVYLDEFARHKDQKAIWEALFGSISQNEKYRISITSTPLGRRGIYYKLVEAARSGSGEIPWSLHECDIHQAIINGCGHDPKALRAGCFDEAVYRQSYLCEFVDDHYALLAYELLSDCIDDGMNYELDFKELAEHGPVYVGVDVGRNRDMFVIVALLKINNRFGWRGAIEIRNQADYDNAERILNHVLDCRQVARCCIDATGIGDQLARRAAKRYPGRVEALHFTEPLKNEIAGLMQRVFAQRDIAIPDHEELLNDLHSVTREVTITGHVRLVAPREEGSHADRYTALGCALHAAHAEMPHILRADMMDLRNLSKPISFGGF